MEFEPTGMALTTENEMAELKDLIGKTLTKVEQLQTENSAAGGTSDLTDVCRETLHDSKRGD